MRSCNVTPPQRNPDRTPSPDIGTRNILVSTNIETAAIKQTIQRERRKALHGTEPTEIQTARSSKITRTERSKCSQNVVQKCRELETECLRLEDLNKFLFEQITWFKNHGHDGEEKMIYQAQAVTRTMSQRDRHESMTQPRTQRHTENLPQYHSPIQPLVKNEHRHTPQTNMTKHILCSEYQHKAQHLLYQNKRLINLLIAEQEGKEKLKTELDTVYKHLATSRTTIDHLQSKEKHQYAIPPRREYEVKLRHWLQSAEEMILSQLSLSLTTLQCSLNRKLQILHERVSDLETKVVLKKQAMVNSAQSIDGHSKAKVARLLAIKMTYEDESEGNLERCANCAVLEAKMQQLRLVLSDATAKKNTLPNSNNKSSQTVGTTLTDISTRQDKLRVLEAGNREFQLKLHSQQTSLDNYYSSVRLFLESYLSVLAQLQQELKLDSIARVLVSKNRLLDQQYSIEERFQYLKQANQVIINALVEKFVEQSARISLLQRQNKLITTRNRQLQSQNQQLIRTKQQLLTQINEQLQIQPCPLQSKLLDTADRLQQLQQQVQAIHTQINCTLSNQ